MMVNSLKLKYRDRREVLRDQIAHSRDGRSMRRTAAILLLSSSSCLALRAVCSSDTTTMPLSVQTCARTEIERNARSAVCV